MQSTARYRPSLSLLTDLYQLTMAAGYYRAGMDRTEACFSLFFRTLPFGGGYAIACGLAEALDYLEHLQFAAEDLEFLAALRGGDGRPLFDPRFLDRLAALRFSGDVWAMPEGTPVFPHEPLLRIIGPLLEAQLVETALLTLLNFNTLIATKAARIVSAARGRSVLEFGLRRAQGIDGALSAARAAYIGGCDATSNVLAGKLYGIPVRGTHAHSWVMAFGDEREAFRSYARALPGHCLFLVDTYDTLGGVAKAIEVGRELAARGQKLLGVRLDSGDLARFSQAARRLLDEAGFSDAQIVASSDLDEHRIAALIDAGCQIDVFGVGTRLVTGHDQGALGGVYKLSAIREADGRWQDRIKRSDEPIKVSTPGLLSVRRYADASGRLLGDVIYDERQAPRVPATLHDMRDPGQILSLAADAVGDDLLVPMMRAGQRVDMLPSLGDSRARARGQLARLPDDVRSLTGPARYPVALEPALAARKQTLLQENPTP